RGRQQQRIGAAGLGVEKALAAVVEQAVEARAAAVFGKGDHALDEKIGAEVLHDVADLDRRRRAFVSWRHQPLALDGERVAFVLVASAPERAAWLRGRVDVVSLATNHALDRGAAGRDDTVRALDGAGVAAAFDGHDATLARRGRRVTILARAFAPDADLDGA